MLLSFLVDLFWFDLILFINQQKIVGYISYNDIYMLIKSKYWVVKGVK